MTGLVLRYLLVDSQEASRSTTWSCTSVPDPTNVMNYLSTATSDSEKHQTNSKQMTSSGTRRDHYSVPNKFETYLD